MMTGLTLLPAAISAASSVAERMLDGLARGAGFSRELTANEQAHSGQGTPVRGATPAGSDPIPTTAAGHRARKLALQGTIEHLRQRLSSILGARLSQLDVDLSEPIVLHVDEQGHVLDAAGHLDRGKIERLFESDALLARQLKTLLGHAEQLHAMAAGPERATGAGETLAVFAGGDLQLQIR